jgi:hypothetical protein
MDTKLESNNPQWRWKRWDVRADGKVFWVYDKQSKNGQKWVTWDQAIKYRNNISIFVKRYRNTAEGREYMRNYMKGLKRKEYLKKYNRSKHGRKIKSNYAQLKRLSDPMFAMANRLRHRIWKVIHNKGYSKTSKTSEMLGCDWNHLMAHLEAKFVDGMTWDNRHLWHIDHITPLASATSEEELIKLNHYTNLQPLWAEDNLRKGNRICANV